jgi:pimeloyl-ACP methyl ester carboxylesterase
VAALRRARSRRIDWAAAYSWTAHVHDAVAVIRSFPAPVHLIGHSMGGGHVVDAARAAPDRVRQVVNIDGFGPPPLPEEAHVHAVERVTTFLDQRRAAARRGDWKPYATLDQLIERRAAQNPRLSPAWLRYFVFHAARQQPDGWRWKADPLLAHGCGPWGPDWIAPGYARLTAPMLAITVRRTTRGARCPNRFSDRASPACGCGACIGGAGHFVHMERPRETAQAILDFLDP